MTDLTWRCSTCANEHDETMPHDTDRASAEGLPQHSYECAAQPDDADCICGVSEAYALGLRDGAAMDEDVLRQMVERPMTSAYFEDFNAGRLDSEQVARALAGDYAVLSTPRTETSEP